MKRWIGWLVILTAAGVVFSGYLSATKLFTGACALNETCPYFLGYPACWYGFVMYLIMFLTTGAALLGKAASATALKVDTWVSFIGIIFSGSFVAQELVLSTCAYGLAFYIATFIVSLLARRSARRRLSFIA